MEGLLGTGCEFSLETTPSRKGKRARKKVYCKLMANQSPSPLTVPKTRWRLTWPVKLPRRGLSFHRSSGGVPTRRRSSSQAECPRQSRGSLPRTERAPAPRASLALHALIVSHPGDNITHSLYFNQDNKISHPLRRISDPNFSKPCLNPFVTTSKTRPP